MGPHAVGFRVGVLRGARLLLGDHQNGFGFGGALF